MRDSSVVVGEPLDPSASATVLRLPTEVETFPLDRVAEEVMLLRSLHVEANRPMSTV